LARFIVVSLLSTTPVLKRSTNPINALKDLIFDFLIYLPLADKFGMVELVVWDKDMLTKEYLGEVALPLDDWFRGEEGSALGFDDPGNQVGYEPLVSS
jgi:phosphatidylserine decarboxylase